MDETTKEQRNAVKRVQEAQGRGCGELTQPQWSDVQTILNMLPYELTHPKEAMASEPTQAEVDAYTYAWEAERKKIGRGVAPAGQKTRAGLRAAFAERDSRGSRRSISRDQAVAAYENATGGFGYVAGIDAILDLVNGVDRA